MSHAEKGKEEPLSCSLTIGCCLHLNAAVNSVRARRHKTGINLPLAQHTPPPTHLCCGSSGVLRSTNSCLLTAVTCVCCSKAMLFVLKLSLFLPLMKRSVCRAYASETEFGFVSFGCRSLTAVAGGWVVCGWWFWR